jgi:hypothetical protein
LFDALHGGGSTGSPPSTATAADSWRPLSRGQQRMLRDFVQEGAELVQQPTASAARQLFWELSEALAAPCSLFGAADVAVLQRMVLELASSSVEQAAALQHAFFACGKVGVRGGCAGGRVSERPLHA